MDDERDDASTQSENSDATGKEDEVGVAPSGLLAGGLTAANMGSGTIGMLGGGALGGLAAAEAVGEGADGDPAQHDQLNLDALAQYGSKGDAGDRGVSQAQEDTESSELNG